MTDFWAVVVGSPASLAALDRALRAPDAEIAAKRGRPAPPAPGTGTASAGQDAELRLQGLVSRGDPARGAVSYEFGVQGHYPHPPAQFVEAGQTLADLRIAIIVDDGDCDCAYGYTIAGSERRQTRHAGPWNYDSGGFTWRWWRDAIRWALERDDRPGDHSVSELFDELAPDGIGGRRDDGPEPPVGPARARARPDVLAPHDAWQPGLVSCISAAHVPSWIDRPDGTRYCPLCH